MYKSILAAAVDSGDSMIGGAEVLRLYLRAWSCLILFGMGTWGEGVLLEMMILLLCFFFLYPELLSNFLVLPRKRRAKKDDEDGCGKFGSGEDAGVVAVSNSTTLCSKTKEHRHLTIP